MCGESEHLGGVFFFSFDSNYDCPYLGCAVRYGGP